MCLGGRKNPHCNENMHKPSHMYNLLFKYSLFSITQTNKNSGTVFITSLFHIRCCCKVFQNRGRFIFFVLRARICRFLALGRTDVVAAKTRPMPPVQRDQNASLCHLLFIYLFILHATSCAGGAKGNWLLKSTMFC